MERIFQLKKTQKIENKKIILGYAPHLIDKNSFVFSPLMLDCPNQVNYEVGSEEGVAMLLAHTLCPQIFQTLKNFDMGYLSAESNVGEEELEEVLEFIDQDAFCMILTQDFLAHPLGHKILSILSACSDATGFPLLLNTELLSSYQPLGESNGIIARITHSNHHQLRGSSQFARFCKLDHLQNISILARDLEIQTNFVLDEKMRGVIAILETPLSYPHYPYQKIQIQK